MALTSHYQCIVVGLGAMGSAALYHLQRRGVHCLGLEQLPLGHNQGSSHGESRVFRTCYVDPIYTRLTSDAHDLWRSLEQAAQTPLLHMTGLLAFAQPDDERFGQQLEAMESLGQTYVSLSGKELNHRFDHLSVPDEYVAFLAANNGILFADQALQAMRDLARDQGAEISDGSKVTQLDVQKDHVQIEIEGTWVTADRAVVTAGPWLGRLLPEVPLRVSREQKVYFQPPSPTSGLHYSQSPVFVEYDTNVYGLPIHSDSGLKLAIDHSGVTVDPDTTDRMVDAQYVQTLAQWLNRRMPRIDFRVGSAAVCLYTCTPDLDFIIDRHPSLPNVFVAGGFSGHGFKFSILVGDILAELVTRDETRRDIGRFSLARFGM